ncbi:MAG: UTP--glucose-1-phosphate uridylyltransferase [Candidatus Goldbacteria bacterium]|nr:UTP--glucose-1-phosphate uridylyltransferase [Candidatus Goldiibacteriota bacterium]
MKIKKAVIPVAGLGTRFLPYTKVVPKEMLPVWDIPIIQFIIEEAINSGIESVLFVTSKEKYSIEDYFDRNFYLEYFLNKNKDKEKLSVLNRIPQNFRIYSVRQKEARGLGDAILHAEDFIAEEFFAVFLPDDLIFSQKPVMKQMIEVMENYNKPVLGVEKVPWKMVNSYGIIKPRKIKKRIFEILDMIEKPDIKDAFSNLGVVGRYILPGNIFSFIKKTKPGVKGEIQITDSLRILMKEQGILAYEFEGIRCDTGNKYDYLLAILTYASMHKELRKKIKRDIKKIFKINL